MRLLSLTLLVAALCLSAVLCCGERTGEKGPTRLSLSKLEFSPLSHAHKHRFRIDKQESSPDKIKTFLGLLTRLSTQLEKNNITYWLDYGTALGAHRGKKIIPWDGDSDLAILKSDHSKVLALKPQIEGTEGEYDLISGPNGEDPNSFLRLIHKSSKLYTDIYHYAEEGDKLKIIINSKEGVRPLPRKLILPPRRCELQKKKFYCPRHLKTYLLSRYTTLESNHEWDSSQKMWVEKAAKKGAAEHRYKPF